MTIYNTYQQKLADKICPEDASLSKWKDWKWQLKNSIQNIDTVELLLGIRFTPDERKKLEQTLETFPLSITPYYLSLIDTDDWRNDPIFRQAFPSPEELVIDRRDIADPLAEDKDSPVPGVITHRYPDRVLFQISNVCSMYCRHCTRKRKVGDIDSIPGQEAICSRASTTSAAPR